MEQRKRLVLTTMGIALGLFIAGGLYQLLRWPDQLQIEAKGNPAIGKPSAKIELVIFEDFKCPHCCDFSREVFPLIKTKYIDTGLVRYILVPLAFINGSKPIANAALAVWRQSPRRFWPFVQEVFARCSSGQPLGEGELLQIARNVGDINMTRFEECLESHCYYDELDQNLVGARKLMGKDFGTPTLYVDGVMTSTSFRAIQSRIDKIAAKKGLHEVGG